MKREIDLNKLKLLKDLYLRQKYSDASDIEIITRWESGESVTSLARTYHRSASSLYRLRARIIRFLDDPPDDIYARLLDDDISVDVPLSLLPCVLGCTDADAYYLFQLSLALYKAGYCFMPRWFLVKVSPRLGRKKTAIETMKNMSELSVENRWQQFAIYDDLKYDGGIYFNFSEMTQEIISSYPFPMMIEWL